MNVSIPEGVGHHALKAALPLAVAAVVITDVQGRSTFLLAAGIALSVLATLTFGLAYIHGREDVADACPRCRAVPTGKLARARYRAWLSFSRWAVPLIGAITVASLLVAPLLTGAPLQRGGRSDKFDWASTCVVLAAVGVITAWLSARRFRSVNRPGLAPFRPVRSFLDGRGKRLRHQGHWFYAGSAAAVVGLMFAPDGGIGGTVRGVAILAMCVAMYADTRHSRTQCEECFTEFRTDAAEYAAQRTWRFNVYHQSHWVHPVGLVSMLVGVTAFEEPLDIPFAAIGFAIAATFAVLHRFHQAHLPWCPHCRGGGGGGESEQIPDPTGGRGKPVPAV